MERPIEMDESLFNIKRGIDVEIADLNKAKLELEQKLLEIEMRLIDTKENLVDANTRLHRADVFTQSHSYHPLRYCPVCFIHHQTLTPMNVESHPRINQFRVLRCACGYSLEFDADAPPRNP